MALIQIIRCWFGAHRRSRYYAPMGADRVWRSRCSNCGVPMRWIGASNSWIVAEHDEQPRRRKPELAA